MNMTEEEIIRQRVINQAQMYLDGYTLREIAEKTRQSHVTVRRNFLLRLPQYNKNLYDKVINKLEENLPDSIDKENIRLRVLESYDLLVNKDMTILAIATELSSTEFVIYRDLTIRLSKMKELYPEQVTQEMLDLVDKTLKKHSDYSHGYSNSTSR